MSSRLLLCACALLLSASCEKPRGEVVVGGPLTLGSLATIEVDVPPAMTVALPWLPSTVEHWRPELERSAAARHIDADLLAIVVLVESGGDPKAKSPSGALGLMQILPTTGRHIANERKLSGHSDKRLIDPEYNVDFGAWYLEKQLAVFGAPHDPDRSIDLGAAAYNAGPGSLKRYLHGDAHLSDETERYIRWVGGMWRERHSTQSATYAAWWKAGGSHLVEKAATAFGVSVSAPPT